MKSQRNRGLRGRCVPVAALLAATALLLAPAGAAAAEPVLELVVAGGSFPVAFTTEGGAVTGEMAGFGSVMSCSASHGEGEVTGPRAAVAKYVFTGCVTERGSNTKCESAGADEEEIRTGEIPAELVYTDQAKHEVAILLNPDDARGEAIAYMTFECGGETAEARGPFLASVSPVNHETSSFTTTLSQMMGAQTPDAWENLRGEKFKATPEASRNGKPFVTTGVAGAIIVDPAEPGMIRAVSAEEVQVDEEAQKQRAAEEARRKHEQEVKAQEEAAGKHRQEEAASKKREEEAAATAAADKKRQEEAARKKRLLAKALEQCKRKPAKRRARCRAKAERRYGAKRKKQRK